MLTPGIISNKSDESITRELLISKFKSLGREYFQLHYGGEEDYLNYIKRGSQLTAFQLPPDKVELFINYEMSFCYWLCDTPVIIKSEEWLRNESKSRNLQIEEYKTIKEFFGKWALLKSDQEKRYFSLSISKLVEKDTQKNNFMKLILYSVILTFDRLLFSPEKAIEMNNKAAELIRQSTLEEAVRTELLYVLKIFAGFLYIKQMLYDESSICFTEASDIKPTGITARYYHALSEKKQGNKEMCLLILSEIPVYDKELINFAISTNNLAFLYYLLRNAFTYKIFLELEFADLFEDIKDMISGKLQEEKIEIEQIHTILNKLNDLRLQEFYIDEVKSRITFLEKFHQNFAGNPNQLMNLCAGGIREQYQKISELLLDSVEQKNNQEIFEKLAMYDKGINDNLEAIKHLTLELEELKKNYKNKLEEAIQYLDKNIKQNIALIEKHIENIDRIKKFNPRSTFNSLMVYNFVITLLVFVVGGFSGCYKGSIDNVYDFRDVMSTVILSGAQWGAITFLLGMIIALLAAGFAIVEKMNERSNLGNKIEFLRTQLERETDSLRKENEKKMTTLNENFSERIEEHKKTVDTMRKEKDNNYNELREIARKQIENIGNNIKEALVLSPRFDLI